ncbi:MAG: discoidin domain-containing protein [Verrucomicrobia bacterium]|nr:discoidin domain-containing protein [Verrucomicrobiota bacterium]
MKSVRTLLFRTLVVCLAGWAHSAETPNSAVKVAVDYPAFLARQDLVFEKLPDQFDTGAFLGNGMLGATIYQTGSNTMRWEMGRQDVTEHRRDNNRIPIGGLVLTTNGKIQGGTLRMDLWNAELRGEVKTDQGTIKFRSFIHTKEMVMFIDLETAGAESAARFAWDATLCRDFINWPDTHPNGFWNEPANPPARTETIDGLPVCIQERYGHGMDDPNGDGGEHATAWTEKPIPNGRRVILSIANSYPGNSARNEVAKTVKANATADFNALLASHRAWWHAFYPKSFVSIPDAQAESFYWIQWYKLASASRPDSPPLDELGPWFRKTQWPRIWWNLNIQTVYLPVYTGNRLELGEALVNFIDQKRANFFRNGKDLWHFDDVATVPHTTDNQGLGGNGSRGGYVNPADFPWALHDYYLHYRTTMDHSMVTDPDQHAFYPLLRGSINLYLHIMKEDGDGKLHLPKLNSPEYADDVDNNYQLSLFRWGLQTLLELNRRYQLNDPLAPKWQATLDKLVPYAVDSSGLRIGPNVAMASSHRHWSHLLMIHPLHIMTDDRPRDRDLMKRSIRHWLTVGDQEQTWPWSRAAGASLYATLGDGDNAIDQIQRHMAGKEFVRPNTMYIEENPVVECSIILNRSVQDMLLQSWGDNIQVFPAVPRSWNKWNDAVFHDLRAEGAFLVSARWQDGKTSWIRIKSLAGEPCKIQTDLPATMTVRVNGNPGSIKSLGAGVFELPLAKGDEAALTENAQTLPVVAPLASTAANPWGVKDPASKAPPRVLVPSLNQGKSMTAPSTLGAGFDAAKAADGDLTTRWSAAGGQRGAWLEVDLGLPVLVGRAVVRELSGSRIRKFAVEVLDDETWKPLAGGTKVSVVSVLDFAPVTACKFRLNITEAVDTPAIEEWGLYPPLAGTEPTLSADCDLLGFACNGNAAMISTDDDAIMLVLPQGTDLTKLTPVCTVSPFATVAPVSGAPVDFSNSKRVPVRYVVTAQATHYTRIYKVTVYASEPGTQLLLNPGFETGNLKGWASDNGANGGYLGVDGVILWEEGQPSYTPHQHNKMCRLQGAAAVGLSQTVALAAGDYALGMWVQSRRLAGNRLDPGLTFELLESSGKPVAPAVAASPAFTPPAGWVNWTRSYKNLAPGTYTVCVRAAANPGAQGWVDDFSLIQKKNR